MNTNFAFRIWQKQSIKIWLIIEYESINTMIKIALTIIIKQKIQNVHEMKEIKQTWYYKINLNCQWCKNRDDDINIQMKKKIIWIFKSKDYINIQIRKNYRNIQIEKNDMNKKIIKKTKKNIDA